MPTLIECPGCARHVRADEGRCPFCARPSTTAAPSRMLVLALPLTLMACTTAEAPPASKTEPAKAAPTEPVPVKSEPAEGGAVADPIPEPDDRVRAPEYGAPVLPPADGGVVADPVPEPDDRVMATKYGGPPVMDAPMPTPIDSVEGTKPDDEVRPAKKYGAPPRPAPKYGGAPKPGPTGPL